MPIGEKPLTCKNCGLTGDDVILKTKYVGGQGPVTFPLCEDEVACTLRWDLKQEGRTHSEAAKTKTYADEYKAGHQDGYVEGHEDGFDKGYETAKAEISDWNKPYGS